MAKKKIASLSTRIILKKLDILDLDCAYGRDPELYKAVQIVKQAVLGKRAGITKP